jgi:hypothetical protein
MSEQELKHVIALLLEDAKRLQQVEPNAGTEARIWFAKNALESGDEAESPKSISSYLLRLKAFIDYIESAPESEEKKEHFLAELTYIQKSLFCSLPSRGFDA